MDPGKPGSLNYPLILPFTQLPLTLFYMSAAAIWSSQNKISQNYAELIADVRKTNPIHLNVFGDLVVMDYQHVKKVFADPDHFQNFDFTERFKVVSAIANNDPALLE